MTEQMTEHVSLHLRPLDLEMANINHKVLSRRVVGYTGCYIYKLEILKSDKDRLRDIMCVPHTYVVNRIMTEDEEREICKMMKAHCRLCFGKPLAGIDYEIICVSDRSNTNITVFQPMYQEEWVYVSNKEIFKYNYDFTPLIGLGYIGDSLLHVISSHEFPTVLWFRDLCLYDLSIVELLSPEVVERKIQEVEFQVHSMKESGYTTYINNSHFDIIKNKAQIWNLVADEVEYPRYDYIPIDQSPDAKSKMYIVHTKFLLVKSNLMSNCTFTSWLRENIQRELLGQKAIVLNIESGIPLPGGIYFSSLE